MMKPKDEAAKWKPKGSTFETAQPLRQDADVVFDAAEGSNERSGRHRTVGRLLFSVGWTKNSCFAMLLLFTHVSLRSWRSD